MKHTYKIISSLTLVGLLLFSACETDLDINTDPDLLAPSEIPMSTELPGSQTGIAGATGSYFALAGGFWSQYWTQSAVANQYKSLDDYSITSSSAIFEGGWAAMYDALTDVRNIKANAATEENWNYYLIATCLEVYSSQVLVDLYDAIPYSEANNPAILNPKFETAQEVYDIMEADLKMALSKDLSLSPQDNIPGETDLIFAGDMTDWTKFANTLLLKIYLRQTEVRASVASNGIQTLLSNGAQFLDKDAAITQFKDEDSRSNPLYESDRRQLNVSTNLRASHTMGSFLQDNSDDRLAKFYDGTTFQYQGDFEDGSSTTSVVELSPTSPIYFISLAESKFLQAEANLRYAGGTNSETLFNQGVAAAFSQWEATSGTYTYPNGSLEENLEAIITQKWVANFPTNGFESFFEQNRTGYPKVSTLDQSDPSYISGQLSYSIEGKTSGKLPRRFEFPLNERQRNTNTPTHAALTKSVWYQGN